MATPTWQAGGSLTAVASGTTRTPVLPAHAANDILVCQAIYNGSADLTITAGWTAIAVENSAGISTGWWWKRAASGAEGNPTVTSSVAAGAAAVLCAQTFVIRGCVTAGDPFEAFAVNGPTSGTTVTGSAITTLGTNRLAVTFVSMDDDVASSSYPPSGWTDVNDITTATGGGAHLAAVSKAQASAGSVAAASFGIGNAAWKAMTLAFRDAVPAAGRRMALLGVGS